MNKSINVLDTNIILKWEKVCLCKQVKYKVERTLDDLIRTGNMYCPICREEFNVESIEVILEE